MEIFEDAWKWLEMVVHYHQNISVLLKKIVNKVKHYLFTYHIQAPGYTISNF